MVALFPLTFGQEQFWRYLDKGEHPRTDPYVLYRITGEFDVRAFVGAIEATTRKHAALRTAFTRLADGSVRQYDAAPATSDLVRLTAVTASSAEQFQRYVQSRLIAAVTARLPSDGRVPVQYTVFRRTAQDHAFTAVFSHLLFDGRSLAVFTHDLWRAYDEIRATGATGGEPEPSFLEAAAAERARYASRAARRNAAYWREKFAPSPVFAALAALGVDEAVAAEHGDPLTVSGPDLVELQRRCRASGHTLFQLLLWAFASALFDELPVDDLVVVVPTDARPREARDSIGMFVLSVPLLLSRRSGGFSIADLHRELIRAASHRHIGSDVADDFTATLAERTGYRLGRSASATYVEHDTDWRADTAAGTPQRVRETLPVHGSFLSPFADLVVNAYPGRLTARISFNAALFGPRRATAVLDGVARRVRAGSAWTDVECK